MSDLTQSFASLVKHNNGLFKSESQAKFLLSQLNNGDAYVTSGSTFGNIVQLYYVCDQTGVVRVEKVTRAKGVQVTWERAKEGKTSIQDQKEIKRLQRLLKSLQKELVERRASLAAGQYPAGSLYDQAEARNLQSISEVQSMLASFN